MLTNDSLSHFQISKDLCIYALHLKILNIPTQKWENDLTVESVTGVQNPNLKIYYNCHIPQYYFYEYGYF